MANLNPTNPLVSSSFLYSYAGTPLYATVSAYGTLGVNSSNSLAAILSGNGNTSNFTASATLNINAGTAYTTGLTALSTTFTGALSTVWLSAVTVPYGVSLSSIQPPSLTFFNLNGTTQSTQGYISSSTIIPAISSVVFTVAFDTLAFRATNFTLSGNNATVVDNGSGSVIDNPFYQNGDMISFTGVIQSGPIGAPGLSSTNLTFRTVAQHSRRFSQEQ